MVTLTLRHEAGEELQAVINRLFAAWRRVRASRRIRVHFDRLVTASVRALEVKWGTANGWHPHIHLLLRTAEWPEVARAEIETLWCRVADAEPGVGVRWSTAVDWQKDRAKYLVKLACEVAGIAKTGRPGRLEPWDLARRALTSAVDRRYWTEFQVAMRGRRRVEFDERAKELAGEPEAPEVPSKTWEFLLYREEWSLLGRAEDWYPELFGEILADSRESGPDPPAYLAAMMGDWLDWAAEKTRKAA
jgi:hypothetical protein